MCCDCFVFTITIIWARLFFSCVDWCVALVLHELSSDQNLFPSKLGSFPLWTPQTGWARTVALERNSYLLGPFDSLDWPCLVCFEFLKLCSRAPLGCPWVPESALSFSAPSVSNVWSVHREPTSACDFRPLRSYSSSLLGRNRISDRMPRGSATSGDAARPLSWFAIHCNTWLDCDSSCKHNVTFETYHFAIDCNMLLTCDIAV